MISKVVLAKLSPTMEEGTVVKWHKQERETVKVGDILAEIETDKANMEMEALAAGVLRRILIPAGASAPVGATIGVIAEAGEDIEPLIAELAQPAPPAEKPVAPAPDGGAAPCSLGGETPLPPAYWGNRSGFNCLDHVVDSVWSEGYSHHITRLMILANLATLLDVSPRELTDWFWIAYTDAYDWVVEPNVLGMGTYALGNLMTTKPYVAGASYINRMSDFCPDCGFDPKKSCLITNLYWAFLARNEDKLKSNPRIAMIINGLAKRGSDLRSRDRKIFELVRDRLVQGERVSVRDIRKI